MSTIDKVARFNRAFKVAPVDLPPTEREVKALDNTAQVLKAIADGLKSLGPEPYLLRVRLMVEELGEVCNAMAKNDPVNLLQELVDLRYVSDGAVDLLGFGNIFDEAFSRVHIANMSKLGLDGKPVYDQGGKIIKGPLFRAANLKDLSR